MKQDPGRVPCEPVARLLKAHLQRTLGESEEGKTAFIKTFAEKVGCGPGSLRHALEGRMKTIDRTLADRILCAIDQVEAWHTEPELSRIQRHVPLPVSAG